MPFRYIFGRFNLAVLLLVFVLLAGALVTLVGTANAAAGKSRDPEIARLREQEMWKGVGIITGVLGITGLLIHQEVQRLYAHQIKHDLAGEMNRTTLAVAVSAMDVKEATVAAVEKAKAEPAAPEVSAMIRDMARQICSDATRQTMAPLIADNMRLVARVAELEGEVERLTKGGAP